MQIDNEKVYPNCPYKTRTVEMGGLKKLELIQKLKQNAILLNAYAEKLLNDENFTISDTKVSLQTVELTVKDLGFSDGATTSQIYSRADEHGLTLCPLELAPYLRLEYLNQPEDVSENSIKRHQAPSGSVTIASKILTEDDAFPKGFYLRRIGNELWLRGYVADHLHVWNPDDHFIFVLKGASQ